MFLGQLLAVITSVI